MFYENKLNNVIVIEKNEVSNDEILPGTKYHFKKIKNLCENNILKINDDDKIELIFTSSMQDKYYERAISSYTYLNLLIGCINNEFSKDIKNGNAKVSIKKDYSQPDNLFIECNIVLNSNDIEAFMSRIMFLTNVFFVLEEDYNKVIKDASTNAEIIRIAIPKK